MFHSKIIWTVNKQKNFSKFELPMCLICTQVRYAKLGSEHKVNFLHFAIRLKTMYVHTYVLCFKGSRFDDMAYVV